MSRRIFSWHSSNLALSSSSPMLLQAAPSCRSSSSSRRIIRMRLPSKMSSFTILAMSEKGAPRHHWYTTSMRSGLNISTYSSTSTPSLQSTEALATRLAISRSSLKGPLSSSLSAVPALLPPPSVHTRHEQSAASCSVVIFFTPPARMSSVATSSSPVLISHASRPFISTTPSGVVYPSRRSSRRRALSSSLQIIPAAALTSFLATRTASPRASFWRIFFTCSPGSPPAATRWLLSTPSRVSTRRSIFLCAPASTLRSSSGSRSCTPAAPPSRFCTSRSVLSPSARPSVLLRSWGMCTRTDDRRSTRERGSDTTAASPSAESRGSRRVTRLRLDLSHLRSRSTLYLRVPRFSLPSLVKFTTHPSTEASLSASASPLSSSMPCASTNARRPGWRKGTARSGSLRRARRWARCRESCSAAATYSRTPSSSSTWMASL
mmetsp:Transcript_46068/g.147328  ORF Transcript_46068/g.147328 Transcript_46068/m.147328 type:complete len:435 (+) Transcript_46068:1190-2494(+)